MIKLWTASDWALLDTRWNVGTTYTLDFSPDGKVLVGTRRGRVTLRSAETGDIIASLTGHSGWVRGAAFSPDGKMLASGGDDGTVRVQNIEPYLQTLQQREMVRFIQDSPQWHLPEGTKARLGKGSISEIQYSPDGTRLAAASAIGIWVYDMTTYQEIALFTGHTGWVSSVSFSPDGNIIASGSADSTIRLWEAYTGTQYTNTYRTHGLGLERLVFPRWKHNRLGECGQHYPSVGSLHRNTYTNTYRAYGFGLERLVFPGWKHTRFGESR